jgi:hypothetical protein
VTYYLSIDSSDESGFTKGATRIQEIYGVKVSEGSVLENEAIFLLLNISIKLNHNNYESTF